MTPLAIPLLADFPRVGNSDAEVLDPIAFKAGNGEDDNLVRGFLLEPV